MSNRNIPRAVVLVLTALLSAACATRPQDTRTPAGSADGVQIHPDNPGYFLFRGKPLVLIAPSEHYGSVINRPFDFKKYLAAARADGQTMTRTFLLYRELQTPRNPWSPCKPESPDYIAPWPRTGPGKALDGEPRYDLDQWNPEFFSRLHSFLDCASKEGIVVELTLFSHLYNDTMFNLTPLKAENNIQGIGPPTWPQYVTMKHPATLERQLAFVRKVIAETADYDNVYYEICNEPAGDISDQTTVAEVTAWQAEIGRVIREELNRLRRKRLVAGSPVVVVKPAVRQSFDEVLKGDLLDVVNFHSHSDNYVAGRRYNLGGFMAKDLTLDDLAGFCRGLRGHGKPIVFDEDNAASMYRDNEAWVIDRKRAWTTVFSGGHYDFIDFSVTVARETGTEESRAAIRKWMRHLSEFVRTFDIVHAIPADDLVKEAPPELLAVSMGRKNEEYVVYLADRRERADAKANTEISGAAITLDVGAGKCDVRFFSPASGKYIKSATVVADRDGLATLKLPNFREDLVLRVNHMP